MTDRIRKIAIIGQGLIGSSITRAVYRRDLPLELTITDASEKVRQRLLELGLGRAKVAHSNSEAVKDADLIIACVPVGRIAALAQEIAPTLKPGAIFSDVGSVKISVLEDARKNLPEHVHVIGGHPLAGTEHSGPDSGLPELFENRWFILTPENNGDVTALNQTKKFWQDLGSSVEIMSASDHDYILAITSHLPHLVAFSIFQTALQYEKENSTEAMKFSAGGFKDFTRIASSNPTMWRDIFLKNKKPILEILNRFMSDLEACANAIETDDSDGLFELLSQSRLTRRKVIEKEHISLLPNKKKGKVSDTLFKPYSSD